MKNYILFIIVLLCVSAGCNKDENERLYTNNAKKGSVTIVDPERDSTYIIPGVEVFMTLSKEDTVSYLYKTNTDADGRFQFNFTPETDQEIFYYAQITANGKRYKSRENSNSPVMKIFPVETGDQSVHRLQVTVTDTNGNPLSGITVCLFTNALQRDSLKCDKAILSETSDRNGIVIFRNLNLDSEYFLKASYTLGSTSYSGKDDVKYEQDIQNQQLIMTPDELSEVLKVKVVHNGDPVGSADVCLFTSALQRDSLSCNQSNLSAKTNMSGIVIFNDLDLNYKYYIKAEIKVGSTNYIGTQEYDKSSSLLNIKLNPFK